MTTDSPRQHPGDRKTLLEIKDLLDRADRLEAEERREAAGSPSQSPEEGKKISYAEFMARRGGISLEEQERRMGLTRMA